MRASKALCEVRDDRVKAALRTSPKFFTTMRSMKAKSLIRKFRKMAHHKLNAI